MIPARTKRHGPLLLPALRHPGILWRYLTDPTTPKAPKLFLLFAIAYAILPVDLIPDMAPIVGWLDDFGVATLAITWVLRKATEAASRAEEIT